MSGDTVAALIGVMGALALVGSALAHRRLETATMLRWGLIWAGIIAVVWAVATIGLRLR